MSRKKKIIAVIALCVLTFALDIVLTVYGPVSYTHLTLPTN